MAKNLDVTNSNSDSNNILKTIVIILIVIGIAYLIYYLYTQNTANPSHVVQKMPNMQEEKYTSQRAVEEEHSNNSKMNVTYESFGNPSGRADPIMMKESFTNKGPVIGEENMDYFSQDAKYAVDRKDASFPKDQLTAEELLPQDNSSLWAQVNPSGEGSLKDRNFLQSGYHIGINTVGQTLRNANLQLRSEPPCPQVRVSPFLNSTIEPDVSRKPFEIGGCA